VSRQAKRDQNEAGKILITATDDVIVTHDLCIDTLGFQRRHFLHLKVDFNYLICPADANRGRKACIACKCNFQELYE